MGKGVMATACAMACALAVYAVPALGAVSSSNVSAPAGPYLTDQNQTVTVSGTTNGSDADSVDLNCYAGSSFRTLRAGVPVQSNGSFSYSGRLTPVNDETCVLRAVPAGDNRAYAPGSPSPYSGPTLGIGKAQESRINGSQNSGALAYYDLFAAQMQGAVHYFSLGGCTIFGSFVYDPTTLAAAPLDYCNGGFWWRDGYPSRSGFMPPSRSELQVDGADAYLAGQIPNIGSWATQNPGFPALTYAYSIDPATGNLAIDETDAVVRCNTAQYPPTQGSGCSSFVSTGVRIRVRIEQGQNGRVAAVTQYFSSTDGAQHSVDLQEDNEFSHPAHDGQLDFPWTHAGPQGYSTAGQVVPGPSGSGPGSVLVNGSASVAGAQGAVTFSNPPDSALIVGTTNNSSGFSWVDLHYSRTVPASGELPLGFTYSGGFTPADTQAGASAAEAAFRPAVSIATPGDGSSTSQASVLVSGRANDVRQLASLTVNGVPQSVTGGAWSTTVSLNPGANTITAVATNLFGNTSQAQTTVAYTPPPPPLPTPTLTNVTQSHRTWRERGRPAKRKPPIGTTIGLTLNMAAHVSFSFQQPAAGRRVGGRCVAPTRRNRSKRPCRRMRAMGSVTFSARAGRSLVKFYGALSRRKVLAPGTYTLLIIATDPSTGRRSATQRLTFTIAM